ncbi:anti-sigma F factor antagonist [Asaccharospora irregularis]|uniref:Anti-sigma F factor antagonist n=1 Tax=Asaccharospora irregularis DSM 2635 TaxID=1121321 RepID=A0A1M5JB66_9FIRM|nr:anti-sigma F factor antagonist [Asaccharospora irregularis]SHG37812.1 anti-anti-sigma regulatory factor, SpoIIAA [Asaccharospora irregularis DSM 2635]
MIKYSLDESNLLVEFTISELDHHVSTEIRETLDELLSARQIKNIVFDFRNISFMDSSGIGVIIGRYKKISNENGRVAIVNVSPRVRKIFDLSGLNKIIFIYDTYEEAESSL